MNYSQHFKLDIGRIFDCIKRCCQLAEFLLIQLCELIMKPRLIYVGADDV